jgi:hypothetical protein
LEVVSKKFALTEATTFIQNIHHFRDENLRTEKPPVEQVVGLCQRKSGFDRNPVIS